MRKPEQAAMGLVGAMEAMAEAAKRFEDFDQTYQANQAAFAQMQQQFHLIQQAAAEMNSAGEERIAALSAVNMELKVRHSQGEQTLQEVRALIQQIEARQVESEQKRAWSERQNHYDAEAAAHMSEALSSLQALVEQLQAQQAGLAQGVAAVQAQQQQWEELWKAAETRWRSSEGQWRDSAEKSESAARTAAAVESELEQGRQRHAQVEQSLAALQGAMQEQGQRYVDHEKILGTVRSLCHQVADRQAQVEKNATVLSATVEAEKGLIGHFEKSLDAVRSMAAEMRKRQAEIEVALNNLKASGREPAAGGDKANGAVAAPGIVEEVKKAAAALNDRMSAMEKKWVKAVEAAEAARQMAAKALEKGTAPAAAVPVPVVEMSPEDKKKASSEFQKFLSQCQADYKAALEQQSKLTAQIKTALDAVPARAEEAAKKAGAEGRAHLEEVWKQFVHHHEHSVADLEGRYGQMTEHVTEEIGRASCRERV